jgi:alpha-tubulin suppressor-like RCC1 family protein
VKLSLRRPRTSAANASMTALAGIVAVAALVACAKTLDRGDPGEAPVEGGASLPEASTSDLDAGVPADAGDEFTIPDGAVICDASPCAMSVTGAGSTFCALLQDGTVSCWGSNDQGQLGYDAGTSFPPASASARLVPGLSAVTSVSVGDGNTCASVTDGGVLCWGAPELVTSGLVPIDGGPTNDVPIVDPLRETAVPSATSVAVGSHVACVTTASGALSCWGHDESLELGRGPTATAYAAPANVDVAAGEHVVLARPGYGRTFAVTATGRLFSWGASTMFGSFGFLLGRDTSEDPDGVPAIVPLASAVRSLATDADHSCAVAGRDVLCWGSNENGQLGRGSFASLFFLPGPTNVRFAVAAEDEDAGTLDTHDIPLQVATGNGHACAVMGSGRVYCWGANGSGQLGDRAAPGVMKSGTPHHVIGLSGPAVQLASSAGAICALIRSGAVECWGSNFQGELGLGALDQQTHPHPAPVLFPR